MKTFTSIGLALGATVIVGLSINVAADEKAKDKSPRLFELRIYTTHPGKLDALNKRFREHTNTLFKKHGMDLVAYWTPTDGEESENTLLYVLAYPDLDARKKAWAGFVKDPDWTKAFRASRKDGPLVANVDSKFMKPTDYSPIK